MPSEEQHEGLVIRTHGGHYFVRAGDEIIDCTVRGRLKQRRGESDLLAIGDRVIWSHREVADAEEEEGRYGTIERVLPRKSVLSRCPPPPRAQVEQVIIANPDQVMVVFSMLRPPPNPLMLDRYLVACEAVNLPVVIVANKVDLLTEEDENPFALYQEIGYKVIYTSAMVGFGVEELRGYFRAKISVLTGPSGVGKSSLLNALWPDYDLEVGVISDYHDRGKHTTVVARLLNPEPDTYVADTPGLRQFRFWDIEPEQLDAFFPEMEPYLTECRYLPCTHTHEPGCAVQQAVEDGHIDALRYESYLRMFEYGF